MNAERIDQTLAMADEMDHATIAPGE